MRVSAHHVKGTKGEELQLRFRDAEDPATEVRELHEACLKRFPRHPNECSVAELEPGKTYVGSLNYDFYEGSLPYSGTGKLGRGLEFALYIAL